MSTMIVLATNNRKKVEEFEQILGKYDIEFKCVADFGPLPEPVEDGETFDDNAYKKALFLSNFLNKNDCNIEKINV